MAARSVRRSCWNCRRPLSGAKPAERPAFDDTKRPAATHAATSRGACYLWHSPEPSASRQNRGCECSPRPRPSSPFPSSSAVVGLQRGDRRAQAVARDVPGVGGELVISVDGHLRWAQLYRAGIGIGTAPPRSARRCSIADGPRRSSDRIPDGRLSALHSIWRSCRASVCSRAKGARFSLLTSCPACANLERNCPGGRAMSSKPGDVPHPTPELDGVHLSGRRHAAIARRPVRHVSLCATRRETTRRWQQRLAGGRGQPRAAVRRSGAHPRVVIESKPQALIERAWAPAM